MMCVPGDHNLMVKVSDKFKKYMDIQTVFPGCGTLKYLLSELILRRGASTTENKDLYFENRDKV